MEMGENDSCYRCPRMPATSKPSRLAVETLAVCGATLLLTLLVLRAGAWRNRGVVGGGDAWQMLWNIDHVQRALRGEEPFYFSARVWAPEGASLRAHSLSPANTLPAAFLASRFGLFTAYNTTLLFSFVLAAAASYRLARRLGASVAGAAFGAFSLAALAYSEWYLAIMGVLAASGLTARERLTPEEGSNYLGFAPLAARKASEATSRSFFASRRIPFPSASASTFTSSRRSLSPRCAARFSPRVFAGPRRFLSRGVRSPDVGRERT
jgi:hypothetical protein